MLASIRAPYDTPRMSLNPHSRPDWSAIDTVLLDLDGTLLDQAYDNHIWRDLVPQRFAVAHSLDLHAAYTEIARLFAERSGTLDWYCIDYWSRTLGVDIGALHREVRSHVAWLPGAREFLLRMRAGGKRLLLLTNSHPDCARGETRGDRRARLSRRGRDVTRVRRTQGACAVLARGAGDDSRSTPARSLFADDNSKMLEAARSAGVRWVYGIRHWDTKGSRREHVDHRAVDSVADLYGAGWRFSGLARAEAGVVRQSTRPTGRRGADLRVHHRHRHHHYAAEGLRDRHHRHRGRRAADHRVPPPPPGRRMGFGPSSGSHSL